MKKIGFVVIFLILIFSIENYQSFGHGLSSETLPSVKVGNTEVSLFAQIIPNPFMEGKQLGIELFETTTSIPTQETTYFIKAVKNDKIIFEHSFQRNNIGLVIHLIPKDSGETFVEETSDVSKLESLYGIDKVVKVTSPVFSENGLYLFEIKILTIGSFQNKRQDPITYNFGLSFPDIKNLELEDKKFGNHELLVISYYDQINDFSYDTENGVFNFAMPFDWSTETINQTIAVHEEFIFPKNFEFLMSANFSAYLNDLKLDDRILTVDDYSSNDHRIVHLVINQNDLLQLYSKQKENTKKMEFILVPTSSEQTKSIEFLIPQWIKNNAKWWSDEKISDNDFSKGIEFLIKEGILTIPETKSGESTGKGIPSWVKNNAGWWSDGLIDDNSFIQGVQFLIKEGIIIV